MKERPKQKKTIFCLSKNRPSNPKFAQTIYLCTNHLSVAKIPLFRKNKKSLKKRKKKKTVKLGLADAGKKTKGKTRPCYAGNKIRID